MSAAVQELSQPLDDLVQDEIAMAISSLESMDIEDNAPLLTEKKTRKVSMRQRLIVLLT